MKKILTSLLVLSVILAFAACAKEESPEVKNPAVTAETKTEQIQQIETAEPSKTETKENPAVNNETIYENLIGDYKKLIEFRFSDAFGDDWQEKLDHLELSDSFRRIISAVMTEDHSDAISNMIDQLENTFSSQEVGDFGYILYDLNKDEMPELFWVRKDHSIVSVFTAQNGEAVLLDAFGTRYKGYVSEKGELYGWGSGGAQDQRCSVYKMTAEGKLETVSGFSSGVDYFGDPSQLLYNEIAGDQTKKISAERFNTLAKEYPQEQSDLWMNLSISELK